MSICRTLLAVGLSLSLPIFANEAPPQTPRVMQWDGVPLSLTVSVGQELILNFDGDVRVGLPATLYTHANVDSLQGRVYLTASAPFETERLQVERLHDGQRFLIDIRAQEGVNAPAQVDIVSRDIQAEQQKHKRIAKAAANHQQKLQMPIPTLLTRFAMQQLYSPAHAIEPLPGVARVDMNIDDNIQARAFPLWPVKAKPVAAWTLNGYTVTAVNLTHERTSVLHLDPRQVTADLSAIAFAFPDLGSAGTDSAHSTAFMVTKGPLSEALPVWQQEAANDQP